MTYQAQPFIILAGPGAESKRETRHNAASAICLADDWAEAGHTNVRIIDPEGVERDCRQFRETLKLVQRAKRRAQALA